jgi:hypothetical protein
VVEILFAPEPLGLIVTPLEEIGFGHRQTSEEDSGSGQSTIIDARHAFFCNTTQKLIKPLYDALVKTPAGKERALKIYARARPGYHPIAQTAVDKIVKKA